jgi:copper(I)-binding protein
MGERILFAAILCWACQAWAGDDIRVDKVWLRESVPGQLSASLQLNLTVTQQAKLIEVSSPWATAVEIQLLSPGQGKIKARKIESLTLPRNRAVVFGDRTISLMLTGLKQPLKLGEPVPVRLKILFADKREVIKEVEAEVKALTLSYKHYGGEEVHDHR